MVFKDRKEAGRMLAAALQKYQNAPQTVAVGLPRGGVVVAAEVAKALSIPIDVVVPRKIGAPHNEELAIGAIAGDELFLDRELIAIVGASASYIEQTVAREKREAERRLALFRRGKPPQNFSKQTILLIDDGIATGATMRASIAWLKKCSVKQIVVAVPVAPADTLSAIRTEADEIICLLAPETFMAVGQFYEHFPQTKDAEVVELLKTF